METLTDLRTMWKIEIDGNFMFWQRATSEKSARWATCHCLGIVNEQITNCVQSSENEYYAYMRTIVSH